MEMDKQLIPLVKQCSACHRILGKEYFSNKQFLKSETKRRCRNCISMNIDSHNQRSFCINSKYNEKDLDVKNRNILEIGAGPSSCLDQVLLESMENILRRKTEAAGSQILLEYKDLQVKLFGHCDEIGENEWYNKLSDQKVDPYQLERLSAQRLRVLDEHYHRTIKDKVEIQYQKGKWLYLVDLSVTHFHFYDSNYEAFDAGCDRCVLPPVVFTIQIGADDERSLRSSAIITDTSPKTEND